MGQLARRVFEDEEAEVDNQADFLGDGNEFRGRQAAQLRVIPAGKGLESRDDALQFRENRLTPKAALMTKRQVELEQKIADIEEEARRANIPPGWLR